MHESVLLNEVVESLNLKDNSVVLDMTLGFAGHSSQILKRIKNGYLFAFDQDEEALTYSKEKLNAIGNNFKIIDSNFVYARKKLNELGIEKVDAILYDLGVSSPQLDEDYRGFSYRFDAPLDMRMDQDNKKTAKIIVNTYSYEELKRIFKDYGESRFASSIARNIVKYRESKEIETTLELVDIIKSSVPYKERVKKHPAKQIFQALRIEVNDELEVLESSLIDSLDLLNIGGRLAVITFHSLEDRIVKYKFNEVTKIDEISKGLPNIPIEKLPNYKLITKKGIKASKKELAHNNRAHSATLRVIERIK